MACSLFFERVCVVFNTSDIANDATFVAGDFFDAEAKELYKLWKPAKLIGWKYKFTVEVNIDRNIGYCCSCWR